MQEIANFPAYLWQINGKPVSVLVNADILDRLAAVVDEGYRSNSWRGVEVGGLLLGRTRNAHGQTIVEVADFEPIESEHAAGPSLMLSQPDRNLLERRLAGRRAHSVVGFYRSNTRREFGVEVEDVNLFSTYFGKASNVFLLIRPRAGGPPMAGFLMWERGKIRSTAPGLEFALSKEMLVARGEVNQSIRALAPVPVTAPPKPAPQEKKLEQPARAARAGAVAVVTPLNAPPAGAPATPAPAPVAARRAAAKPHEALKWTAAALVMAGALVSGMLSRTTPHAAGAGQVETSAQSAATEASQPISVLDVPADAAASPAEPPAPAAPGNAASLEPPAASAPVPAPMPPKAPWRPRSKGASQRVAQPRPLAYAAIAPHPTEHLLPEPPAAGSLPSAGLPLGDSAGDSFCRVTVVRASHSRFVRAFSKLFKHSVDAPPAPVFDPAPMVPPDVRQRVSSAVDIEVRVLVAADGAVQNAELLSKGKDPALADLALYASRRSEFTPAREGGQDVPGEVVLRYRFGAEDLDQ